jgi:hypothetical protein
MQNVVKILFLDSHPYFVLTNLVAVTDEHGKLFHQENVHGGEAMLWQVEPQHVGRLLLDINKGCPRGKIQV